MYVDIIIAAITSAVTILTALITMQKNQIRLFLPYQGQFMEQQIFELLAPMDKILTLHTVDDWKLIKIELKSLIEEKYVFVPSLILSICTPLLSKKKISYEQFLELKSAVSSMYNWEKKEMRFSYNQSQIIEDLIPITLRDKRVNTVFLLSFSILSILATILAVVLCIPKVEISPKEVVRFFSVYFASLFWFCLLHLIRKVNSDYKRKNKAVQMHLTLESMRCKK